MLETVRLCYDAGLRATQGARNYQEDTAIFRPGMRDPFLQGPEPPDGELVAVLADGMGGHAGGAMASRMACEEFLAAVTQGQGSTVERLLAALETANGAIAGKVAANPVLAGMGSTLVGAVFSASGVEFVSVGDSPLLLFRRGKIAHLNEDHSLAPELDRLAAAGHISIEEARRDPRRHMLRSAVTGDEIDLVDVSRKPLAIEHGDVVILASDGLHTIDDGEIERVVAAYADDGASAVAGALIRAVEQIRDPHQDNATVVVVRALATVV